MRRLILGLMLVAGCRSGSASELDPSPAPSGAAAAPPAPPASAVPAALAGAAAAAPAGASCPPRPACDAPLPALGPARPFRHRRSSLVARAGSPRHRGRDLFVSAGSPQWILGKIAYGDGDKDLSDEDVDVYLLRGCGATWEKVGTYRTTPGEGSHPTTLGVHDDGGQIFLELSSLAGVTRPLDVGRHRVRLVVAGDLTGTDLFLEVLPPGARVAVSDIDGTLTSSEVAVVGEVAGGDAPPAHPGAPEVMQALAERGFYLFYLTARPDWLVDRTRAWLDLRKFPPGILHTTITSTGVIGDGAARFKALEIAALLGETGITPTYAFGNMPSDVATYGGAGIPPSRCYYFRLDSDLRGGVRNNDYRDLVPTFAALPAVCP